MSLELAVFHGCTAQHVSNLHCSKFACGMRVVVSVVVDFVLLVLPFALCCSQQSCLHSTNYMMHWQAGQVMGAIDNTAHLRTSALCTTVLQGLSPLACVFLDAQCGYWEWVVGLVGCLGWVCLSDCLKGCGWRVMCFACYAYMVGQGTCEVCLWSFGKHHAVMSW